jgi:hypothetical protein
MEMNRDVLGRQLFREALAGVGRRVLKDQYVPQPSDFPVSREEPAYLKTVWMRVV